MTVSPDSFSVKAKARSAESASPVTDSAARDSRRAQQLFAETYLGLVRLAAAVLRDVSWAEDVVQDAFARTQPKLSQLGDRDQALRYLRKSVVNGARSELRKRKVRRSHLDSTSPENMPPAELIALNRLQQSHLLAAVAQLPNRQRAVVLLRFVQDMSIAETAKVLSIGHGAVKASQRRAMDSLRRALGEELE